MTDILIEANESSLVDELASRMVHELERLDPSIDDVTWETMPEPDRDLYRFIVRDLSRYADKWRALSERLSGKGHVISKVEVGK